MIHAARPIAAAPQPYRTWLPRVSPPKRYDEQLMHTTRRSPKQLPSRRIAPFVQHRSGLLGCRRGPMGHSRIVGFTDARKGRENDIGTAVAQSSGSTLRVACDHTSEKAVGADPAGDEEELRRLASNLPIRNDRAAGSESAKIAERRHIRVDRIDEHIEMPQGDIRRVAARRCWQVTGIVDECDRTTWVELRLHVRSPLAISYRGQHDRARRRADRRLHGPTMLIRQSEKGQLLSVPTFARRYATRHHGRTNRPARARYWQIRHYSACHAITQRATLTTHQYSCNDFTRGTPR